jgi:Co/Zn/Cd efflux system component
MEKQMPHDIFSGNLSEYHGVEKKRLILSLLITSITMMVELVGGLITNSIALISDAGHMFTHCFAIGTGLVAIVVARKPPCHHRTFGLYRAEILAAFINGLVFTLRQCFNYLRGNFTDHLPVRNYQLSDDANRDNRSYCKYNKRLYTKR